MVERRVGLGTESKDPRQGAITDADDNKGDDGGHGIAASLRSSQ